MTKNIFLYIIQIEEHTQTNTNKVNNSEKVKIRVLKNNRQTKILELLDQKDYLKVTDASELLGVTEMTIRRDLLDLQELDLIERVYGGAKKKTANNQYTELSHIQKKELHVTAKKEIAKKAAALIKNDDVVFIGPGTTTEYIYDYINVDSAKIITNSISVFNRFKDDSKFDLILIGGKLRERTASFVGYFTRKWVEDIHVDKVFIGTNGIIEDKITTAEEEEGFVQQVVLKNSHERYVMADSSKFGVEAFQVVTTIDNLTAIITDNSLSVKDKMYYENKYAIIK